MRFRNREIQLIPRGDQFKTLSLVDKYAEMDKYHPFIVTSIYKYKLDQSTESLRRIFNAIHKIILFEPDPQGEQWVKTVNRTLKDLRGNCVDYTVIFSAFLRALKIPHEIDITEYPNQEEPGYSHIYVQTLNGITLDAVIGQNPEGESPNNKYRLPYFNVEVLPVLRKHRKLVNL